MYGEGYSGLSNNLCPYFWGTILAIFTVLPVIIFRGIKNSMSEGSRIFVARYGGPIAFIIIGGISLFTSLQLWFTFFWGFVWFGFSILLCETNVLVGLGSWFSSRRKNKPHKLKPYKERKPSMTIEMIKGWKNKHCPRIEWEG